MEEFKFDESLDCRDQSCPMPVLNTAKKILKMESGKILEVLADDEGAIEDIPSWCEQTGNQHLGMKEEEGFNKFYIKKS